MNEYDCNCFFSSTNCDSVSKELSIRITVDILIAFVLQIERLEMSDEYQKIVMDKKQDSLEIERTMLVKAIKKVAKFTVKGDGTNRKKNKIDSTKYRQEGNKLFKSYSFHNADVHTQILKLYTQAIALAPNNSEELSAAYGNRSALLFHFKKYEECLKDCDLALSVCKSDESKVKFLCRKVECLSNLRDSLAEKVRDETLYMLDQMYLGTSTKEKYSETLKKLEVKEIVGDASNNQNVTIKLPDFTPQKQAPCASEAVAIKYDQEWGRHIVATRNIDPGEIVAVEKSYYAVVFPDEMWFYCQNCVKFTWSSIPCEHCIYGIYCSIECRQEAWEKFHKFECEVYPYIWDLGEDLKGNTSAIRLLLLAVNELGGISELREEISEVENNQGISLYSYLILDNINHSFVLHSLIIFL